MSAICLICRKKSMRGNWVSHSKQRTHRLYRVNLHAVKTILDGVHKTIKVCTKCLRRIKKVTSVKPVVPTMTPVEMIATKVSPVEQITQTTEPAFAKASAGKEVKVKTTTIAELMKESDESKNSISSKEKKETEEKKSRNSKKIKTKKSK